MRASIEQVVSALGSPEPPAEIWQQVFEGDIAAYHRLCSLRGQDPDWSDLFKPIQDMCYAEKLQPSLLRYVFPICLRGWALDLMDKIEIGGIIENFWLALARRTSVWEILGPRGSDARIRFMRDTILDRMDRECKLSFSGMCASPYAWFYALGSLGVVCPALESLWRVWWDMETRGLAVCVLQYASCLMYEDDRNPVFSPWTRDSGGGPPALWEVEGHIYEHATHPENIAFLKRVLSPVYLESKVKKAADMLRDQVESDVPARMVADFPSQLGLVGSRIDELPRLLAEPKEQVPEWSR